MVVSTVAVVNRALDDRRFGVRYVSNHRGGNHLQGGTTATEEHVPTAVTVRNTAGAMTSAQREVSTATTAVVGDIFHALVEVFADPCCAARVIKLSRSSTTTTMTTTSSGRCPTFPDLLKASCT